MFDAHVVANTIILVRDDPDPDGLFCIYCLDSISVIHSHNWFFRHATINDYVSSDQYLGILESPCSRGIACPALAGQVQEPTTSLPVSG